MFTPGAQSLHSIPIKKIDIPANDSLSFGVYSIMGLKWSIPLDTIYTICA